MDFQDHDWKQRGSYLICETCSHRHGMRIPVGKMLTGSKGQWNIVIEQGQPRDTVQLRPMDVSQSASHSRLMT